MTEPEKDWKLKLHYGKLITPYQHFTVIASGIVGGELSEGFYCPVGNAYMGMKVWAENADQAADIISEVGLHIGFPGTGNIEIFETEPLQPPGENPGGYDIRFTPFNSEQD